MMQHLVVDVSVTFHSIILGLNLVGLCRLHSGINTLCQGQFSSNLANVG